LLVLVGLVCLGPALGARFVLVDDHEILVGTAVGPTQPQAEPALDFWSVVLGSDPAGGRFRPLYWAVRLSEIHLLADNPAAWHALVFGLGLVAASLLFASARLLGLPTVAALWLGIWLLVAPGVSSVWVRLGPQETIGIFFFVLSVFGAVMAARGRHRFAWDCLYVLAGVCCILSKETMALAAPALALLCVVISNERGRWLSAGLVLGLGLLVGLVAALIGASAGTSTYGGRYLDLPPITTYLRNLLENTVILIAVSGVWLLLLAAWARRPSPMPTRRPRMLAGLAVVALCVAPQLVVYSKTGLLQGRYELPAALALAGATSLGLVWLLSDASLSKKRVVTWAAAALLVLSGFWTWTYAAAFAEDSWQLSALVQALAQTTPEGATVGIVADPEREFEPIRSLTDQIEHSGRGDLRVVVLPLSSQATSVLSPALLEQLRQAQLLDEGEPLDAICGRLSAVVVLPDEATSGTPALCPMAGWEQDVFSGSVLTWGRDFVPLRQTAPHMASITYQLFRAPSTLDLVMVTRQRKYAQLSSGVQPPP
jgi:hypothetical protein